MIAMTTPEDSSLGVALASLRSTGSKLLPDMKVLRRLSGPKKKCIAIRTPMRAQIEEFAHYLNRNTGSLDAVYT
jgi:hypothetical protein